MDEFFKYADGLRVTSGEDAANLYEIFSGKKISLKAALSLTQIRVGNDLVIICCASDLYSLLDLEDDFKTWLGQCIALVDHRTGIGRHIFRFIADAFGTTSETYWFSAELAKEIVIFWGKYSSSLLLSFYLADVVDNYGQAIPNVAMRNPESGYQDLQGIRPFAIHALAIQLSCKLSKRFAEDLGDFINDSVSAHFGVRSKRELKNSDFDLAWALVEKCQEFFAVENYDPSWNKQGYLKFVQCAGDFVISHPAAKRHRSGPDREGA